MKKHTQQWRVIFRPPNIFIIFFKIMNAATTTLRLLFYIIAVKPNKNVHKIKRSLKKET